MLFPGFCVEGQSTILEFGYFVLIGWKSHKKTRNPEAESEGLVNIGITSTTNYVITFQHRSQWHICNAQNCAQLANTKSE